MANAKNFATKNKYLI